MRFEHEDNPAYDGPLRSGRPGARVIAIASGKQGVGKTTATINLATALASNGTQVCILDTELEGRHLEASLGLEIAPSLEQTLNAGLNLQSLIQTGPRGVCVLRSGAVFRDYARLAAKSQSECFLALTQLEEQTDYLFVHVADLADDPDLAMIRAAHYGIVVISRDPDSFPGALKIIEQLDNQQFDRPIYILVNMVEGFNDSIAVFKDFQTQAMQRAATPLHYLGYVTLDEALISAARLERPVLVLEPQSPASRCFQTIADAIEKSLRFGDDPNRLSHFWRGRAVLSHDESAAKQWQAAPSDDTRDHPIQSGTRALAVHIADWLASQNIPEGMDEFLQGLFQALTDHSEGMPVAMLKAICQSATFRDQPETEWRHLLLGLESTFEQRFQSPLHDTDTLIASLLRCTNEPRDTANRVLQEFRRAYEQRFSSSPIDGQAELFRELQSGSMAREDFTNLVQGIRDVFRAQFNEELPDPQAEKLDAARVLVEQLKSQEDELHDTAIRLFALLQALASTRESMQEQLDPDAEPDS